MPRQAISDREELQLFALGFNASDPELNLRNIDRALKSVSQAVVQNHEHAASSDGVYVVRVNFIPSARLEPLEVSQSDAGGAASCDLPSARLV